MITIKKNIDRYYLVINLMFCVIPTKITLLQVHNVIHNIKNRHKKFRKVPVREY